MFVIIAAFRAPHKLSRCLEALEAQSRKPTGSFVHDNSNENLGFTAAMNRGLREALRRKERYALLLNQDAYLPVSGIEALVRFLDKHKGCAIVGVKQLLTSDPDVITHGGCKCAYPFGEHIVGRKSRAECAESMMTNWVNGAVMGVRLEAVVEFGLMDERMYLVGSDADWCFTARLRGWEVWYCAEVEVLHDGGISACDATPDVQEALLSSSFAFFSA
jgi:GT2 family glycosyltransferase